MTCRIGFIPEQPEIPGATTLGTPSTGFVRGPYRRDDGSWYEVDDAGVETLLFGNGVIGQTIFPIWAEENGGLANGSRQWSFGNGATGAINIVLPIDCELFAVSFDAEVGGAGTVSLNVMQNDVSAFTTKAMAVKDFELLGSPLSFVAGDCIGFQTNTEVGTVSDARVCAWFRIASSVATTASLDDLLDVSAGTPSVNDGIVWNGLNWVNQPVVLGEAQMSNTDTTTNLNASTAAFTTLVPMGGTQTTVGPDFTVNLGASSFTVNFSGVVSVSANVHVGGAVVRAGVQIRTRINGAPAGPIGSSGYIRNASGHNESSLHISNFLVSVSPGDVLTLGSRQEAGGGVVSMVAAGSSTFSVRRVS